MKTQEINLTVTYQSKLPEVKISPKQEKVVRETLLQHALVISRLYSMFPTCSPSRNQALTGWIESPAIAVDDDSVFAVRNFEKIEEVPNGTT